MSWAGWFALVLTAGLLATVIGATVWAHVEMTRSETLSSFVTAWRGGSVSVGRHRPHDGSVTVSALRKRADVTTPRGIGRYAASPI